MHAARYTLLALQGSEDYCTTVYEYDSAVAINPKVGSSFDIDTMFPVEPPPVFVRFVVGKQVLFLLVNC